MKKILIITVCLVAAANAYSQQSTGNVNADAQNLERIRQNQIKNKAAEDALKMEAASRVSTTAYKNSNSGLTNMPVQTKSTAPVENKSGKDEMGPKPVVTNSVVKTDVKPVETKTAATVSNLPGNFHNVPATTEQQKVAEVQNIKGTSADPNATVQTETVKVVAPAPDKAVTTEKPASRPADSVKDKKD